MTSPAQKDPNVAKISKIRFFFKYLESFTVKKKIRDNLGIKK